MKKFYLIFALFFGLTFNLSAQETVIAVWDFADNSLAGEIHPDFSSAVNPDMTYMSGGHSSSAANAFTNDDVTGGDFDMSYTMTNSSPNTGLWSNYILNQLDLGPTTGSPTAGSGLVNNKLHLSLSFKSITIEPGSGDKITFILKDANNGNGAVGGSNEGNGTNHRLTGLQLVQNGTNQNIRANVFVYNNGNSNGTSKMCGHFGNTQGMTLTDITIGVTVDYSAGSVRFWIDSPDTYMNNEGGMVANSAWGFKMFNSDGYVNTSGFPMLTGTPTGAGATALANSVVQMLQFSPVLSGNSEFVFDQIKISTGEYENTVAAGNTSTEDGVTELYFSKYGEGSSNNKFLEIYNGTNSDIDLSNYAYPSVSNAPTTPGEYEFWNSFDEGAVVAAGDVYVIAHPSADASILAQADETHQYLSNGDDGYALVSGGTFNDADGDGNIDAGEMTGFTIIDWLGDWNGDPGSGWEVAGVSNGTKDHTLTRKWTVCGPNNDWTSSAGTNADDSEWIVGDSDSGWDTIGSFTGCTDTPPFVAPSWAGDWVLDPVAGALAVGPTATDLGWWSSSAADVDTRACLFDDIYRFNIDGSFEQVMQGSTWLEGWQTGAGEECGTPVAPHDGSNPATYSYTGDTVTVVGDGAFLGLAKVHNGGEDGNPVDDTITYNIVSVDDNYLVVNINFGPGYWQFRFRDANYAPPTTDVTFAVNTANIEVGASGMFLGGGIFGDAQAHAMSDDDGDGIWEVTLTLNEGTTGNYIFLNGPADGGDWGAKEVLAGQDCADAANNNDRILDPVGADDYRIEFCFGECTVECPALDTTAPVITLVGDNPVEVYEGATYTDAGATASDDVDGDLTASIVVVNPVDTSVIGEYTITYNVSDAAGNPATEVTRTVNVVADPCPVVAGAWAHTFDVVEGTVPDAACWLVANGGDANTWVVNTNGEWQIQYSSTAHDDYLISPAFTVISGTSDRFSFEARNQSTFYLETMDVQVWDAGITTMLGTLATAVGPGTANEAYEYALSAYAGQDVRVAFHITTTDQFYMYVDNVTVDAIPSCQAPTDLSVSGVTATEATVAWSSPNDGDSFEYQVVEGGTTPAETGTATSDSSVDLTGLSSVTTYDFYVRSVCSDGSLSDWSSVSFTTELQAPGCGETLSYDYPTGSSGGSQFANNFAGADASDLLFTSTVDNAGDELTLTIGGSTESGWDWVYVTDGAGTVLLAPVSGAMDYEVVSSDGTVNVYIASDTSVTSGPVIFAVSCDAPFDPPTWVGDWVLDPVAGALAVGPTATDLGWWSSSAADVDTRACLFDDIYRFNIDGSFEQVMQGSTWLEGWQTGAGEECGTPVAPHDGSNPATYSYTGDTVTVVGDGAFLGLAKVHNTGEDGNPVDDTITYNIVSVDDNYLVVNIQFGAGYWQFRFRDANYAPPTTDVTFAVNTANIEVGASGMFLGGGIFGDAQAHAMSDDDGDGIWEVTLTLNEGTTGNYIFLNGPADGGDWGAKEDLAGQDCADAANNNDRILDPVGADDYRIEFCFGECTVECPALDTTAPVITLVGDNPVEVYEGATYTDAGATASDDVDGDLTASIVVVNPVDTSVIGEYTITYNVSDAAGNPATEVTRTVNVVADPCPVVAGAWAHTFDVVEGTVPDAACWLVANGGDANTWVVNTNGEWQIQYSSTAHDDYLISPAFTVISGTSDRFSFEARNQSTFYLETMDVQVWDAGVTTMLGTLATAVGPGTANEAYEYALSAYAGQDVRVAFHITTTDQYYMYVDNVTVDAIPSCQAPTDLSVSGVTATEATVAWSSPNDGGSFEYQVVEGGTTPAETGTATPDSSVDLTGLSSVTTYDFYVRALCSDGSLSDWSSVSFTTELQAPGCGETLSYDYPTGSSGGSQFANNFAGADASDLLFTSTVDNAGDELTLTIGGSTESGWDWVYVTDGAGTVLLAPVSGAMDYEVVSSDGTVNVYIASDGSITQGPVTFAVSCATPFDPPTWVGDWVLDPVAAALAVGPTATDLGWWSNSAADVDTRACLFDDIWSFNEDGTFEIEMQGSTWLEGWQTGAGEECGTPVAPHDGSNPATYSYDEAAQTVTVVGDGAFLGLAKVHNTGEDGNPVDDTITYNIVSVDENYLVVNINFGPGYWQFRFRDANYAPPTTDVTFAVNTANIEVGASGMFLGGGIFGDAQAHAMSDDDGDGIWEVTLTLNEGTTGNYIFLNGPADGGDWGAKEDLAGQDCADGQFNDRLLDPVGADDYRIEFCFGECTVECTPLGLDDPSMSQFTYFPNPVNDQLTINSQRDVKDITVYNMLGQVVVRQTPNMRNCTVDMSSMQTGAYFVQVSIGNTVETVRVLKK